ncbi:hypothetical protein [Actinoplanes sp. ATCC 53533]|uniref:hypothetical protein n=1 Tax=Actinoplanes sp. ATCC 53533 TaxID=1288362 RepID=UPI000F7B75B7|nr:hypothetical protein [Actinoplanes sp. ATCC 53533]
MNAIRRGSGVAAVLIGALTVAGCGAAERGGTGTVTASARPATAAAGQPADQTAQSAVRVDRSYWYAGFKVTLGTARLSSASSGGGEPPVLAIDATFQNLSPGRAAAPSGDLLLTSGADSYGEPAREQAELPEVPARRSRTGVIAIEVDDRFDLTDAVLTVGEPQSRQAVVPLARPEGLISLEPRPISIRGRVYPEGRKDVFVTLTGGEVRADDAANLAQAPAGQEYVLISFSATNNGPAGMTYVFDRDLNLVLPDGTKVGDAGSCSRAQVHVQPNATVRPDGPACFAVPAPATGAYRFVWDNKDSEGLRFSIG